MKRGTVEDTRFLELTKLGVDAQAAQAWLDAQEPLAEGAAAEEDPGHLQSLPVWPENWPVLGLFLRLQTQWLRSPHGRPEGFNYPAVESAMRMLKLPNRTRLFDELVEMEHAVLEAWDEL